MRDIVFAFLFLIIYGAINLFFYNYENEWYQTFCPYKIKADIVYIPVTNKENTIHFSCKSKREKLNFKNIDITSYAVTSTPTMTVQKIKDTKSLNQKLFYGIYKLTSVFSVFYIVMFTLLYQIIGTLNFTAINMLFLLILGATIIYFVGLHRECETYKKIKQLTMVIDLL